MAGLELLNPHYPSLNRVYAILWAINYFPPESTFSLEETLLACRYTVDPFVADVQMKYFL